MRRIEDDKLIGQRYGRLVVIEVPTNKATDEHRKVVCRCDCGNVKEIALSHLRTGSSRSCGCGVSKAAIRRNTTHGDSGTRLHNIWLGMRRRCFNKNESRYGGRGITVRSEWSDYLCFKKWSISNGYRDDLTLDRIDTNGNYSPSNCRWIVFKEQARNRTNNRLITINGQNKLMTDWLKVSPVTPTTVYDRLRKGWSVEDALFTPGRQRPKKM